MYPEVEAYDAARSITLKQAREMIQGRGGGHASIEVVRRYANPRRGCRPRGQAGPVIVLRAILVGNELRCMRSWVETFNRERQAAGEAGRPKPLACRTDRQREAGMRRANKILDQAGI